MSAYACDVPVFRYALERWLPDRFEILVFYKGEMPEKVRAWQADGALADASANCVLVPIDLENMESDREEQWDALAGAEPPWVLIRNPQRQGATPIWSGPLDDPMLASPRDSPLRREVARRLLNGESAVWILLESGHEAKDNQAATLLEQELSRQKNAISLPASITQNYATSELRIDFSLLRLSRIDPAEQLFVQMLINSEPDLLEYGLEPMAFPVYGRGRVLYALVGQGINAENIEESCFFLTGACSCEVKELNPGTDLLLAADWDSTILYSYVDEWEMSLLTAQGRPGAAAAGPSEGFFQHAWNNFLIRNSLIIIVALLAINGAFWIHWMKRRSSE